MTIPVMYTAGSVGMSESEKDSAESKARTSQAQNLVDKRNTEDEEDTQEPHSECVRRHEGIVHARDGSSNFGVRRFA